MHSKIPIQREGAIEPGLSTDRDPAIPIYAVHKMLFRSDGPVLLIFNVVRNAKQQCTVASASRSDQQCTH